ncbi:MAG: DUF3108 domain-containing protein [Nitrospirae bacterium]|nr:DUF3108 domain-containing protein [Nitrospirota bacterium]
MKLKKYKIFLYTCILILFCGFAIISTLFILLESTTHGASFRVPERFVYDLTWAGIKAGTATLEIVPYENRLKIISTAQSANWVSVFYTVDDRIESILTGHASSATITHPEKYRVKLREGRHRRDKEVIFDHSNSKALYIDYLKNEKKEFTLPSSVFDPISSFFYLRTRQLVVGESTFISMFDSKKVWNVEVQALRKEKVSIPLGTFNTIVIKPLMKSEGIFYSKGEIFIWLTDDEKHIPVKLQSKVAVGHITATLVSGYY